MYKFILCVLAQLILLSPSFGQSPAKAPTGPDLKAQQELNKKALALLAETIEESRHLKTKENRVLARIALADLLWKDQEPSARRLYQEAFEIIRQARDRIAEGDPESFESENSAFRLRDQLLRSLGNHDPRLAKELLHRTKLISQSDSASPDDATSSDPTAPNSERVNEDTNLELTLATEAADKNPEEAVRAARKALGEGYSYELTSVVMKLAEKHSSLASELAVEIADKLRKADFGSQSEAVGLALFMVANAISSLKPDNPETNGETGMPPPLLPPQYAREFLEFIIDAAVQKQSRESGSYLLFNLRSTVDELEAVAPAPAARLKQRLAEFDKENVELGSYSRLQELSRTNDIEAILETARTAPVAMRDSFYSQAATAAWEKGDLIRANEIVTKHISNAYERNRLLLNFQEQAIEASIAREDFDQAHQLIASIRSPERRVAQLVGLAAALTRKKDNKGALAILNEVQNLLPVKASNVNELELQLRLARSFAEMDVERSFALHTSVIDQISDLLEAIAKVSGFTHAPTSLKDNEFAIESYTSVPGLGLLFSREIRVLAQTDFERTKKMFDRFPRPEIRVAAYLYMSRTILEPEAERNCTCEELLKKSKQQSP